MFFRNILFLQLAFLHTVFPANNIQCYDTTPQRQSKPHEKSNRVHLEFDFDKFMATKLRNVLQNQFKHQNEVADQIKNQLEELRRENLILKGYIQTRLQKFEQNQKEQDEDKDKTASQLRELQQKQDEVLRLLKEHKNESKNSVQKLEQKQKNLEQLLSSFSNDTTAKLENVNKTLESLKPPRNCRDLQNRGKTLSGVYTIWPIDAPKSFDVWCDMETRGGGWVYIVKRFDGSLDFNLNWTDYKNGFGDLNGEHWLGLEPLYLLTRSKPNELLIELVDEDSTKAYANYKEFSIGNEDEGYPIETIKGYNGDAGDDFSRHLGWKFTTRDRDQDTAETNCAVQYGGGFWYHRCFYCSFTGTYNSTFTGIKCQKFRGFEAKLKEVRMMVRS